MYSGNEYETYLFLLYSKSILFVYKKTDIYSRVSKFNNAAIEMTEIRYLSLFHTEWL